MLITLDFVSSGYEKKKNVKAEVDVFMAAAFCRRNLITEPLEN